MQLKSGAGAVGAAVLGLAGLSILCAAAPAAATGLIPHRAVYDMKLQDADESSGIAGLSGLMVYEFSGSACEGYSVSFRFVTEFQDMAGGFQVTDLRASSFEDPEALTFQFLSKTYVDQKLIENTRGTARSSEDEKTVELQEPDERTLSITKGAMFPTEHLNLVIEAAREGKKFLAADVYDGSENGDKVYSTTAVIGAVRSEAIPESDEPAAPPSPIKEAEVWPVSIAYFDGSNASDGEQTPVYQLGFLLYDNGISRQLTMDYGDFVIQGRLRQLEIHEESSCTN